MGKKLVGNGIFEGSRMILTEHRDEWIRRANTKLARFKPTLDDQEIQEIEYTIVQSYNERTKIKLILFDPYEDKVVSGIVVGLNTYRREVKLATAQDEWEWVYIKDIISASAE